MPKVTFFNLSEQKRERLMESAEAEFSRVSLFEASIANIVKMANIPRGSFYQYFEDKEDLYFYLLEENLKEVKANFLLLLKKNHGDVIEAMIEMYNNFLVMTPDEEEHNFLRNAMMYATHKVENSFTDMFVSTSDNESYSKIIDLIDKKHLNIKEDKELHSILQIIFAIAFHNFMEKIAKQLSDEEAVKQFKLQMDLVKHGIYK